MIKNILFFLVTLIITVTNSALSSYQSITITEHTQAIHMRYYYINRLKSTVDVLKYLEQKKKLPPEFFTTVQTTCDITICNHEAIQEALRTAFATNSLESFFALWELFTSYHYITDAYFTKQYIYCINQFYKELVTYYYVLHTQDLSEEPLLLDNQQESYDVKPVTSNQIAFRYYILQRLGMPITCLQKCQELTDDMVHTIVTALQDIRFETPIIIGLVTKIALYKSLDPLFAFWQDLTEYRYIQEELVLKEFLSLVLIIEQALCSSIETQERTPPLISQPLEQLPLEQMLLAIDKLAEVLVLLIAKYELNSSMSWKDWFKKYWWATPLIGITIGVNIMIIIKTLKEVHAHNQQQAKPENSWWRPWTFMYRTQRSVDSST